jgi:hypothetical protein
VKVQTGNVKPWNSLTFAPHWYADAVEQSQLLKSRDAIRREIVFAVCAAESYLLEWVRDEVLNHQHDELLEYFPANRQMPVRDRWKDVLEKLVAQGRIRQAQNFNSGLWSDFSALVDFRNGLVHGGASRPQSGEHRDPQPYPTPAELDQTSPGWAVGVVRALIEDLHATAGTTAPKWLYTAKPTRIKAAELWKRWTFRDRIRNVVASVGILIFLSPLVFAYYIDFDELSATQLRLLAMAWVLGSFLPLVVVDWMFRRFLRREYEEFVRGKQGDAVDGGNGP